MQRSILMILFSMLPIAQLRAEAAASSPELTDDFGIEFEEAEKPGAPIQSAASSDKSGIWDKFAFRFTQQIYSRINSHPNQVNGEEKTPGIEDNRLTFLVKYQNAFAPGWSLQGSAQTKLYWPSDYEDGKQHENTPIHMEYRWSNFEARINELYLSKNWDQHTFKLGRQTIVWGENEGNSILDTINYTEYRDLSIIELEDARLNQWFGVWEYFSGNNRLSTFINFNPQFNPLPRKGSPAYVPLAFTLPAPKDEYRIEAGSRLQWSIEHSDFSLMAAYLYENNLHYQIPAHPQQAIANAYWLFGASANRAIGKLLLKLDLAYSHGIMEDTQLLSPSDGSVVGFSSKKKDQVGLTAGFDYALTNQQNFSLSAQARYFIDRKSDLAPNEQATGDSIFGTWLLRYSNSFQNGDLVFSSTLNGSLTGDRLLVSGQLLYTYDDHWSVLGQVISTWASKNNAFSVLNDDIRFGFNVSYAF